ncbi:MAG TPA: hypothetical protein PKK18_05410 [Chitinophagales bacterium]|nr:hypothetical protein [Chitinophagales bacterium]HMZ33191.1 hypothetical protein [Chitinophagales bacterium]HNB47906.1 hypothetical protein [Chitinophagales bacterium]HNC72017.1 hypothetical protein [Chitinophagales bacterium]HNF18855.1 hypothetical protein [Chitinophagales bacterium]
MKKTTLLFWICCFMMQCAFAQSNNSKKQFDDLWNKTVNDQNGTTKDLNALEKNKIESIDVTQKPVSNPNYNFKKVDTSNLEELSTKPIIKNASKGTAVKPKEAVIDLKSKTKTSVPNKEKNVVTSPVKKVVNDTVKPKQKITTEDFSNKPIVKSKEKETSSKPSMTPITTNTTKQKLDTAKGFREFTFETTPVVNNNATYHRKNEPLPKSKEQIEAEIPVNRIATNKNTETENVQMKAAYAQYDKEADSLHSANKRRLDSIMQALNIKVPIVINPTEFIDIFVNGGGVIANGDSKIYDRISILHTGNIQRETKSKNDGVQRSEKKISKDELTKLAQYIVDMGFFDFNEDYDCTDEEAACNQRFSKSPQPVPLEVSLTVGQKKHKIKVAIYSPKSDKNWVNYPANLEKIMNAIYTVVEK